MAQKYYGARSFNYVTVTSIFICKVNITAEILNRKVLILSEKHTINPFSVLTNK